MEIITINGVVLPSPTNIEINGDDINSSGTVRNEVGVLLRDRIRADVYTIDLEFNNMLGNEIALIESAIESKTLSVRFPDTTGFITKSMYLVSPNKRLVTYDNDDFDNNRWNMSFTLEEY